VKAGIGTVLDVVLVDGTAEGHGVVTSGGRLVVFTTAFVVDVVPSKQGSSDSNVSNYIFFIIFKLSNKWHTSI